MSEPTRTLAETVAEYEPANDVADLDTACRLITALRQNIAQMAEESEPSDGEYTAFLDAEHIQKLYDLFDGKKFHDGSR